MNTRITPTLSITIPVQAAIYRRWGATKEWVVDGPGAVSGTGRTQTEAKTNAAALAEQMLTALAEPPVVVLDDQGALLVFTAILDGYTCLCVDGDRVTGTSTGDGTPQQAAQAILDGQSDARKIY